MPEVDVAPGAWRGIDELAELIGAYCWVENRIFELSGVWASDAGAGPVDGLDPALRVWCAGVSRRHGHSATRWAERLPVRAGVDRDALVAAPAGPLAGALAALAAGSDFTAQVAVLALTVLPLLQAVYGAHGRTASPVSEAPVLEVLAGAHRELSGEISSGRALLEASEGGVARDPALGAALERAFLETSVFPAVRTS